MDEDHRNKARGRGRPRLPDPATPPTLPPQRRSVRQMTPEELAAKRAYDRLASRRSWEIHRRNRITLSSLSPGVDELAVRQRLVGEGLSQRQISLILPAVMREEAEKLWLVRELKAATRGYLGGLQPDKSQQMGRFGAALMAPTSTGSFFEAFGKATEAALDQRNYEEKQRAALAEKKYHAELGLARLAGDRAVNPIDEMRDQFTMVKTANEVDDLRGDSDLRRDIGNGLTPSDDAALIADYRRNPNKYRSPLGQ